MEAIIRFVVEKRLLLLVNLLLILGLVAFTHSTITNDEWPEDPANAEKKVAVASKQLFYEIWNAMLAEIDYVITRTQSKQVNGQTVSEHVEVAKGTVAGLAGHAVVPLTNMSHDYKQGRPWTVFLMGHHEIRPGTLEPFITSWEPLNNRPVVGESNHEDLAFSCLWMVDKLAFYAKCHGENGRVLPVTHLQPLPNNPLNPAPRQWNLAVVKTWANLSRSTSDSFPDAQQQRQHQDELVQEQEAEDEEIGTVKIGEKDSTISIRITNNLHSAISYQVTSLYPEILDYATCDVEDRLTVVATDNVATNGGSTVVILKKHSIDYVLKKPWELTIRGDYNGKNFTFTREPLDNMRDAPVGGMEKGLVYSVNWIVHEAGIYYKMYNQAGKQIVRGRSTTPSPIILSMTRKQLLEETGQHRQMLPYASSSSPGHLIPSSSSTSSPGHLIHYAGAGAGAGASTSTSYSFAPSATSSSSTSNLAQGSQEQTEQQRKASKRKQQNDPSDQPDNKQQRRD